MYASSPGVAPQLLSNAIQATRERGRVGLRVLPEGDDRFRVEVEDSGIGIASEDLSRVFLAPAKEGGADERGDGAPLGLGLAATKRIAHENRSGGMQLLHTGWHPR